MSKNRNRYPSAENYFSVRGNAPQKTNSMTKSRGRYYPIVFENNILETTRAIVGPDVSVWQNKINWNKMVETQKNLGFAMCKATDGANYIDTNFVDNITNMRKAFSTPAASRTFGGHTHQVAFGVYHFANIIPTYTDSDYQYQADFFYNTVANAVDNNIQNFPDFWVLDWEYPSGNSIPHTTRANYAKVFVQQLYRKLMNKFTQSNVPSYVPKIFIYVDYYYWGNDVSIDTTDWFTTYGPKLWIAGYITNYVLPTTDPNNKYNIADKYTNGTPTLSLVKSLGEWMVWQYTDRASVPGISSRCDVSVARTSDDWNLDFYQTSSS